MKFVGYVRSYMNEQKKFQKQLFSLEVSISDTDVETLFCGDAEKHGKILYKHFLQKVGVPMYGGKMMAWYLCVKGSEKKGLVV